ncbi:sigma 54 modulation/S30EA ribosomal C-terminal domain-containing protein [Desulfamplus magnetovallimortis]|uniref:sigma 54 modulation/S30EA ribosomal C-terminal domain-containing protein n=1 Tax=Desulfamplus magnetovallimortis TaxID=1246637 RepID=UPI00164483D9|nr:sigma 54 modulation/S30EA ribosomal C-terminal domain-containing protein [Desulfamplus magnetovallimortis]
MKKKKPFDIVVEVLDYKPMDVEDAIAELNAGKETFFVFNNSKTEQMNVLYRRYDGSMGLIQPQ